MYGENILERLASSGFLKVKVKPDSSETKVRKVEGNVVFVDVKAPPVEGKANAELLRFLRKILKRKVSIRLGESSRIKIIKVI